MKKLVSLFLVLFVGLAANRCSENPVTPETRSLSAFEKRLIQSDNLFGFDIFKRVVEFDDGKNVFISPLSISMALGMTLNGANGETRRSMEEALKLSGMTSQEINEAYQSLIALLTQLDPNVVFQIANSIWYRQGWDFEEAFINTNRTFFDAEVRALDFNEQASVDIINQWVADNTNDKIKKIIERVDAQLVMLQINAIYFNGTWTYEFDKDVTMDGLFYVPSGSPQIRKLMVQTSRFDYYENEDLQAIDLPYGDRQFSMTVLLPKPGKTIESLVDEFNQDNWSQWTSSFSQDSVTLYLPRIKMEYEISLNGMLDAMGMGIAFSGEADFTNMYKPGGLNIDFVKHKTFLEIDEEGTEAAAVTAVGVTDSAGSSSRIKIVRVDRPFLFVIRESHSQTMLFMGKIVDPTQE